MQFCQVEFYSFFQPLKKVAKKRLVLRFTTIKIQSREKQNKLYPTYFLPLFQIQSRTMQTYML